MLLAIGAGVWLLLDHLSAHRVATGTAAAAVVEDVGWNRLTGHRIVVSYQVDGVMFERTLRSTITPHRYEIGDPVTVYVDQRKESRVATAEGFTSLGLWMMSPWPLLAVGGALVAIIAPERWVRWWRLPAHVRRVDRIPTLSVRLEAGGHRTERWREAYERLEAVLETNSAQLARADGHRVFVRCRIGSGRRDAEPDGGKVTGYARKAKLITVTVDLPADPPADADAVLWANVKNAVDRAQQFARDEGLAGDLSDVHECLVDR